MLYNASENNLEIEIKRVMWSFLRIIFNHIKCILWSKMILCLWFMFFHSAPNDYTIQTEWYCGKIQEIISQYEISSVSIEILIL